MSPITSCGTFLKFHLAYDLQEALSALVPVLLQLCQDSVAAVRFAAGSQLGLTIARIYESGPSGAAFNGGLIAAATEVCRLASSSAFQHRQVYALAFEGMAQTLLPEDVMMHFWPAFSALAADSVPNVRLTVCRTLLRLVLGPKVIESESVRHSGISASTGHLFGIVAQAPVRVVVLALVEDSDQEVARVALQILAEIR